ncbi:MAG: hypothetical protein K2X91_14070, partial [Thermoleophilia bacterium]|nr:hypothetical protein [Thermoleophilia bacterium]
RGGDRPKTLRRIVSPMPPTLPVDPTVAPFSLPRTSEVVEIGLLLPASWAEALVDLSKRRGESVAQILRGLVRRELEAEALADG